MADAEVRALVDRIVASARIPRRAARAALRRELQAHFDDAAAAGITPADAIHCFGAEHDIVSAFRRVYVVEYVLLYALKVGGSIAASLAAALTIEFATNLRIEPRPVLFAMAVVVTVVAAWELARPPAGAVRAALARGRLAVMFALFAGVEFSIHLAVGVPFGAPRAVLAGLVLTLVSVATILIIARMERAFVTFFDRR